MTGQRPDLPLPEVDSGQNSLDDQDDYGQEPRELIDRADTILRAGRITLATGLDTGRVMDLMRLVAKSLDCDALSIAVAYPQITITVQRGHIYRTKVSPAITPGVNSDRAVELWQLMRTMRDHMTPDEINEALDRIEKKPHFYSHNVLPVFVAIACCCYGVLNNMGWYEIFGTFVAAGIGHRLRLFLNHKHVNHMAAVTAAAATSGFVYLAYLLLTRDLPGVALDRAVIGFIASVLYLVPGYPIVSGSLDLGRLDFDSGINRLAYAGLVLLSAGIGIWVVSMFSPMDPTPVPRFVMPDWQILSIKGFVSFLGVFCFSMLFNGSLRLCVASGAVALVTNVLRLVLAEYYMPAHAAAAVACFVVGLLAWLISKYSQWPSIVMAVPATLVMIPGAASYRALLYLNQNDMTNMLKYGVSAVLTIIGISVGLLAARIVTDKRWALSKDEPPSLREMLKVRNLKA